MSVAARGSRHHTRYIGGRRSPRRRQQQNLHRQDRYQCFVFGCIDPDHYHGYFRPNSPSKCLRVALPRDR